VTKGNVGLGASTAQFTDFGGWKKLHLGLGLGLGLAFYSI
jgi:hypothetical protein